MYNFSAVTLGKAYSAVVTEGLPVPYIGYNNLQMSFSTKSDISVNCHTKGLVLNQINCHSSMG